MKARMLFIIILAASLALLSTWAVSAQEPQPPAPSPQLPPQPLQSEEWKTQPSFTAAGPQGDASRVGKSLRVSVGQPGLSFRYVRTFGVTAQAYTTDNQHLNAPSGLFIDGSNNVYVVEDLGLRMLKFNSSGSNVLTLGTAGLCYADNYVFCTPQDIALDASGNIWLADGGNRVVEYNASGIFQQTLPATNSWQSGNDTTHFNWVTGIAFDNVAGRMFVSDNDNHRIQVYTFSGGAPVYNATIGETSVSGSDNSHFNRPRRLAVDSSGRLYVVDSNNGRVQRCSLSGTWSCTTFASGLNYPEGIGLDGLGNVFIADTRNSKIRKCDSAGGCADFVTGFPGWTRDVAVDSSGNAYVSNWDHGVIRRYDNSGTYLGNFVGTTDVPYFVDTARINTPWGIAVASDGSIYVAENTGHRLIKMSAAGTQQWTVGTAGIQGYDNTHFQFPQGSLALDAAGRVYVPNQSQSRIQVYNSDSSFYSTFGSYGTGNNQFGCTSGVFINPANGDINVVDRCNQRIQVYTSGWTYKGTLGTTGVKGSDGTHFNNPQGVWVDASGYVYVADGNNHRIQKCTLSGSSGTCTTFIGQTGTSGSDFDHLSNPQALAMDSAGHLHVVDQGNNRVQVFDSSGAYLTTIGGSWGTNTGQLRAPAGIAIDSSGNVYVTDRTNSRIQKFAPGVPGWAQTNINGFGDLLNQIVTSLAPFGGQLYAGTRSKSGNGAQLWRLSSGGTWSSVITPGFGITRNVAIDHLFTFSNQFYAGTWADSVVGGQVWRSSDGATWDPITLPGFDTTNGEIYRFAEFNNKIYASTWSYTNTHGAEIWRSDTGDSGTWSQVVSNGFNGNAHNISAPGLDVFGGFLYAGTDNWNSAGNTSDGAQVWRSSNGTTWDQVNTNGFGNTDNNAIHTLAGFNGHLYVAGSSWNATTKTSSGGKIWRCATCDGSDWTQVVSDGFQNLNNDGVDSLAVLNNTLYAATVNRVTGMEIWRTTDGTNWTQLMAGGFGNSNNPSGYWGNAVTVLNKSLYYGTNNSASGGQVWQLMKPLYLPLLVR